MDQPQAVEIKVTPQVSGTCASAERAEPEAHRDPSAPIALIEEFSPARTQPPEIKLSETSRTQMDSNSRENKLLTLIYRRNLLDNGRTATTGLSRCQCVDFEILIPPRLVPRLNQTRV